MRRRTKKLLLRLIPITVVLVGIVTGFTVEYFLRIPKVWYTGNTIGEYNSSPNVAFNVDTQNDLVFMTTRNSCLILDIDDPYAPSLLAEYDKGNPARRIERDGDLLAITGDRDVNLVDISNPSTPTNLSVIHAPVNYTVADVALLGDYALVAVHPDQYAEADLNYRVLHSYNISDPENPTELDLYRRFGFQSYSMNIHNNIAYVINPTSGIVLVNVTDPTNLTPLGILIGFGLVPTLPYAVNARESGISTTATATYIIIADYDNGYIVADVTNPTNPLPESGEIG